MHRPVPVLYDRRVQGLKKCYCILLALLFLSSGQRGNDDILAGRQDRAVASETHVGLLRLHAQLPSENPFPGPDFASIPTRFRVEESTILKLCWTRKFNKNSCLLFHMYLPTENKKRLLIVIVCKEDGNYFNNKLITKTAKSKSQKDRHRLLVHTRNRI